MILLNKQLNFLSATIFQQNFTKNYFFSTQKPKNIQIENCINFQSELKQSTLDKQTAILYALGIGFNNQNDNINQINDYDLQFTYENHKKFKIFPTIATCQNINQFDVFEFLKKVPGLPHFNPMHLLHGEQELKIYNPDAFTLNNKFSSIATLKSIEDKKKAALISIQINSYQYNPNLKKFDLLAFQNTMNIYIKDLGNFQNQQQKEEKNMKKQDQQIQILKPKISKIKTNKNQGVLYRLSGDYNYLHIDPVLAKNQANFEKPILHGLCTLGISIKQIFEQFGIFDLKQISNIKARFTSHVFPGETLQFEIIEKQEKNKQSFQFQGKVVDRNLKQFIQGQLLLT